MEPAELWSVGTYSLTGVDITHGLLRETRHRAEANADERWFAVQVESPETLVVMMEG